MKSSMVISARDGFAGFEQVGPQTKHLIQGGGIVVILGVEGFLVGGYGDAVGQVGIRADLHGGRFEIEGEFRCVFEVDGADYTIVFVAPVLSGVGEVLQELFEGHQ